jgi:tetratricopeptide (TPR) repeat protein
MVALGIALVTSLPQIYQRKGTPLNLGLVALGVMTVGWYAARAAISPIAELWQADLLLLAAAAGSFICVRALEGKKIAEQLLIWGIALLLLASIVVAGIQIIHKDYTPIFHSRIVRLPSGFFGHYNEGANFVIGSTLLVAGAALFGQHNLATRIFFGLLVIAGFAEVYVSRSRGGILSVCLGAGIFIILSIVVAKRHNSRWFARSLLAFPIIGFLLASALWVGWQDAQQVRSGSADINTLLDNDIRLYLAGIAISCMTLHPWGGGGSRSYSWESYRFWDSETHGVGQLRPDMVHNEILQAATDYGIIGVILLILLVSTIGIITIVRLSKSNTDKKDHSIEWRVGGLAALVGMVVQSNFSFVFHLIPQLILLGVCLGFATRRGTSDGSDQTSQLISKLLITGLAALCVAALIPFGIKGTKVTFALWPSMFSKDPQTSVEARIDGLSTAIRIWPTSIFYQDRALIYAEISKSKEQNWATAEETQKALDDYTKARVLHPYDPSIVINQALMLSFLARDLEAEDAFNQTIRLQGGMESLFAGNYHFANHLYKKGLREYQSGEHTKAVETLTLAAKHIEIAIKLIPWNGPQLRLMIHESLGAAQEGIGDQIGALETYDFVCTVPNGQTAHYRAGALLGKMAVQTWEKRQPSEALGLFLEAQKRVIANRGAPPTGITGGQRAEYIAYLSKTIQFLQGAKITPTPRK